MSNIQDITSLSDLLTTSPSQPLEESSSNKDLTPSLNLAASILVKKTAEDTTMNDDAEEAIDESEVGDRTLVSEWTETPQKNEELSESHSQSISPSTTENQLPSQLEIAITDDAETSTQSRSDELSNVEILLSKQSEKISLQDELKDKVRQCSDLKATVEDLRATIKYLKEQKRRKDNKRTLELLLEENNINYSERAQIHQHETQTMLNEEDDEDCILKNLNVLPSNDWAERLDQIRRFVPYLELDNIATSNFYSASNELQRSIEFVLLSPLLFKIPFKLVINVRDETLNEIIVLESSALVQTSPLTTLSMLSSSLKHTIVRNYIPKKKINLIMFGLSSLSMVIHRRISAFYNLIRTFSSILRDRTKFSTLLSEQELQDNIQLFAMLKSIDNVEFLVENNNTPIVIRLTWQVKLENKITAECASDLRLHVSVLDDAHADKIVKNADALFAKLINEYGIIHAFKIVLENAFNIKVDEKKD